MTIFDASAGGAAAGAVVVVRLEAQAARQRVSGRSRLSARGVIPTARV
jgi:hypothetical protein